MTIISLYKLFPKLLCCVYNFNQEAIATFVSTQQARAYHTQQ